MTPVMPPAGDWASSRTPPASRNPLTRLWTSFTAMGASDESTGLLVYSLYGATRRPSAEALAGVDALVFDIQEVGVRFYTYISTMLLSMRACAETGKEFIVLDRPNPISGTVVEGGIDRKSVV